MEGDRILIIEDDKQLADTIKARLIAERYDVEAVHDGSQALGKIIDFKPQLILLDILLPGKDGRDILVALKKQKGLKDIPVVIISGKDQQFDRTYGLELGAVEYIIKPFSLLLLSQQIKRLLKKREQEFRE